MRTPKLVVDIRPVSEADIPLLQAVSARLDDVHHKRFRSQQAGQGVYLAAWNNTAMFGHLMLDWNGTDEVELSAALRPCPHILDVWVVPAYRSHGIGQQLIRHAETLALNHGFRRTGLSIALDNVRAHLLYERLGYADAHLGPYVIHWTAVDHDGHTEPCEELCVYLVKPLAEQTA